MKKQVAINNKGNEFKEVEVIGEREILLNGELLGEQKLSVDELNILDIAIDEFEEGGNILENGYEIHDYNVFTIRRKVK